MSQFSEWVHSYRSVTYLDASDDGSEVEDSPGDDEKKNSPGDEGKRATGSSGVAADGVESEVAPDAGAVGTAAHEALLGVVGEAATFSACAFLAAIEHPWTLASNAAELRPSGEMSV
jgi:hypothetical protein